MNILIAYFSRKGSSLVEGKIIDLTVGNTEVVANKINTSLGGTLFEIETVLPYSADYHACATEVVQQMKDQARPELKTLPVSLDAYDVILIGYPNWCGTMPMPVWTFLSTFDFSNKKLVPFCTHGGSGMGHSESDIKSLCPSAEILASLAIQGTQVAQSDEQIATWLKTLNLV